MIIKKITIYTYIHLATTAVLWLLMFTVAMGIGFKDDWSLWDHTYTFVVTTGVHLLAFPVWWITLQEFPSWVGYTLIPIQVLSSFIQVNILLFLWQSIQSRNKALKDADKTGAP